VNADEWIRLLQLEPHPEGGWYRETWRAPAVQGERPAGTAIYYLLRADRGSHWHRVDAAEIWHHYAGASLALSLSPDGGDSETVILGPDLAQGERPQIVIDAHVWQAARTLGEFTLVGCTVSPGFEFRGFEMADPEWRPRAHERDQSS
jgi:predicted cupin superfamily sugar epimerase